MAFLEFFDRRLRRFLAFIILVVLLSLIAVAIGIPTEFHLWEIPINVRILAFAAIPLILDHFRFVGEQLTRFGIFKWRWKSNLVALSVPIIVLFLIIVVPQIWGKNVWDDLGNSPTSMLASLLDIPALYAFSLFVVLLDEIVFRGFLLGAFRQRQGLALSIIITTLIWAVASSEKIFHAENNSLVSLSSGFLYFMSIGFASSAIFCHTNSVWNCYSYRIGLQVVSSAIIGSGRAVDPEFLSQPLTPLYLVLLISLFNISIAIFFVKRAKPIKIRK